MDIMMVTFALMLNLGFGYRTKRNPADLTADAPPTASMVESTRLEPDKQKALDLHNVYRCMAGVRALEWDDGLAQVAQKIANKGLFEHSADSERTIAVTIDGVTMNYALGENLAIGSFGLEAATAYWYDEIGFTNPWGRAHDAGSLRRQLGHYTQVMWKGSRKLGCAEASTFVRGVPDVLTVCHYAPAGNIAGYFIPNVIPPWKSIEQCGMGRYDRRWLPSTAPPSPTAKECYKPGTQIKAPCEDVECFKKRSLVISEGNAVTSPIEFAKPFDRLQECVTRCANVVNCHSFATCKEGCWLKDKVITADSPSNPSGEQIARECSTYMKVPRNSDGTCPADAFASTTIITTTTASTTTTTTTTDPCPWKTHHTSSTGMALCTDGQYDWQCAKRGHGQRQQCPSSFPMMCESKTCGGGEDYCCEKDCAGKGGPRKCANEVTTTQPTQTGPDTTTQPTQTGADPCPWKTPHTSSTSMALCTDGQYGWQCAKEGHGQRQQCPSSFPMMCESKTCGGGEDHCCETDCVGKGGPRKCANEVTTTQPTQTGPDTTTQPTQTGPDTTTQPTQTGADPCPWTTPHTNSAGVALCKDGEYSWLCSKEGHGQRQQCPSSFPMMCESKTCGGGEDYCCEKDCAGKGGQRQCSAFLQNPFSGPMVASLFAKGTPQKLFPLTVHSSSP